MEKTKQKPQTCIKAKCGASCYRAFSDYWSSNPAKCPNYKYMPYLYERAEAFESVGIYVKAKINRLCNDNKHDEAETLEKALEIIMSQNYDH